jgi:TDG/mug DNA glycosylase family protein
MDWMGQELATLADLIPVDPRAICVGINPAPSSVAAGHYYQGQQGQRFFARLHQAGLLVSDPGRYDDDVAYSSGIGFTDVVKRPTASASMLTTAEMRFGARLLGSKLERAGARALIFPFKAAAVALVGRFRGNGWLPQTFAGARLFVMPGPYESTSTAAPTIATLAPGLESLDRSAVVQQPPRAEP